MRKLKKIFSDFIICDECGIEFKDIQRGSIFMYTKADGSEPRLTLAKMEHHKCQP